MKPGVLLLAGATTVSAAATYHVKTKFKVGGEGGWDYLIADSDARRLYVSHGHWPRLQLARGWHANRCARRFARQIQRGAECSDGPQSHHHGTRSEDAQRSAVDCGIRTRARAHR